MGLPMLRTWLHERHQQLHMARWMLEFDDRDAERAFRAHDDREGNAQVRPALLVAIVFTSAYGVVDYFVTDADVTASTVLRFAVLLPVLLISLVTYRMAFAQRHLQVGSVLLLTLLLGVLGPATALTTDLPIGYLLTSATVTLIGGVGLLRLRMHAAWTVAAVFTGVSLTLVRPGLDPSAWVSHLAQTLGLASIALLIAYALEKLRRTDFLRQREVEMEQQRSDDLLNNVLPPTIAKRLRTDPGTISESAAEVSVLFSDIVGFTPLSETLDPAELVRLLDTMFREFDELCDRHRVEKVKTVGDAYMAVAGLPDPNPDHAASMAELALDMQRAVTRLSDDWPSPIALRIGIASGPAVAGVIGQRKFAYDLWGDTVNTASRMESHGRPNRIQVSEATRILLAERFEFSEPQQVEIKGKGAMTTYFLLGRAPGATTRRPAPRRTQALVPQA